MKIRILHLVLSSCLIFGCTSKSSKNKIVDFDSIQTAKLIAEPIDVPNEETIHVNYETPVPIKYMPVVEEEKTDIYQIATDIPPEFPKGNKAVLDFIYDNLKYPSDALEKGIQGRVIVGVVIDENGSVAQPKILKSISPSLDKEALRIVSIMPKWKAGKLNGVPVKVKMSFPVIFKLPNDDNALKTDSLIESIEE